MKPEYTSSLPASPLPYGFKRLGLALCYMLIQVTTPLDHPGHDFSNGQFMILLEYHFVGNRINLPSFELAGE